MKPKWTPTGSLLYTQSGLPIATESASEWQDIRLVAGEGRDIVESVLKGADKDVSLIFRISIYCTFSESWKVTEGDPEMGADHPLSVVSNSYAGQ
jgi:hypothetical protein